MAGNLSREVIRVLDDGDCAGPASDSLVKSAEDSLRVEFPAEYRNFLRQYGAALLLGVEIYGLAQRADPAEPPIWSDLRTLARQSVAGLPADLIPVSDDGGDYRFYLRSGNESPVLVYGPGLNGIQVASSFSEFVLRAVKSGVSSLLPTA